MSERASIGAEQRLVTGKKAKQLRRDGWIPAVIYGQGENRLIQLENLSLRRVLRDAGTTSLIDISVGDQRHTVLAREIQSHPTRGDLYHIDFYEVNMQEKIVVEATLVAIGESVPEVDGLGTTSLVLYSVEIECLPGNLISEIEVDLSQIKTPDDYIQVKDLPLPEGVVILNDPEAVVASFDYTQEEAEEEEEEELLFAETAEEVEVIHKGKAEEDENF
jgi:large subunit ribosomal protein L25